MVAYSQARTRMADHKPRLCGFCKGPLTATRYCSECESMPAQVAYHILSTEAVEAIFPVPCDGCVRNGRFFDPFDCMCRTNRDTRTALLS
jgi:hypothetical protein